MFRSTTFNVLNEPFQRLASEELELVDWMLEVTRTLFVAQSFWMNFGGSYVSQNYSVVPSLITA